MFKFVITPILMKNDIFLKLPLIFILKSVIYVSIEEVAFQ